VTEPYYKHHWIEVEPERHRAYEQILDFHRGLEPMVAALDLHPGMHVLDVGSGPGQTTIELARRVGQSGRITAIDINREFVVTAKERARKADLGARIEFINSEFPPLPFPDSNFERVWCKNVLEYVDSAAATIKEMARVAARGALVAAIDSDWEMIALEIEPEAQDRSDRIIGKALEIAIREPRIGRKLHGLFRAAGLKGVKVAIMAGTDLRGAAVAMQRASFARYAIDAGVAATEVAGWLQDIENAIARGRYLFVLPQFVVTGIKQ
jgi:ubiquinone/menaquinone biosynthesis C-methylase UbiE